jgi:EmrB/QacA subfamily drug resistance transporter
MVATRCDNERAGHDRRGARSPSGVRPPPGARLRVVTTASRATPTAGVLPILAVAQFLMTVDATVMNVSIGALVEDLDTSVTAIQGVITTYTLVMAAAMITGGKLGDLLGRRRALRIGLLVYAAGSGLTAVAPNVGVLLVGWSVLEGLGAALIMPTVVALVAGNFEGERRAAAYGTIAAAAAVAVAAGPIIGGFATANFSWRWVFVAEVLIAFGIMAMSGRIPDVDVEERPQLDLVGAGLSATGLAVLVLGVLQSTAWGWVAPRVRDGDGATPQLGGVSLTTWLILGGLVLLFLLLVWLRRRQATGREPLFDPDLFRNPQLRGGLTLLFLQFVMTNGLFFTVPLFLSIVLGLDAFETGLRMLPLSIALVVVAPAVPKLAPRAAPRTVVRIGLSLLLAGAAVLAVSLTEGADAGIVFVPFLLIGAALGLLASQIGNVIVSSEPVERSGEVGGLQYTAQNLGASLGTAVIGAVVIGSLAGLFLTDLTEDPRVSDALVEVAGVELEGGAQFVSDAQVEAALATTDLTADEREAILDANRTARIEALQLGAMVVALLAVLGLFASGRLPDHPLVTDDEPVAA